MTYYPPDLSDTTNPELLPKVHSDGIRKAAAGNPCSLRIGSFIGIPCASQETTCFDHGRAIGRAMGSKTTDLGGFFGCDICHAIIDGRNMPALTLIQKRYPAAFVWQLIRANAETNARLLHMGLIVVPDGVIK